MISETERAPSEISYLEPNLEDEDLTGKNSFPARIVVGIIHSDQTVTFRGKLTR